MFQVAICVIVQINSTACCYASLLLGKKRIGASALMEPLRAFLRGVEKRLHSLLRRLWALLRSFGLRIVITKGFAEGV